MNEKQRKVLEFRQHVESAKLDLEKMIDAAVLVRLRHGDDFAAIGNMFLQSMNHLTHGDTSLLLSIALVRLTEAKNAK
jgi:hypothetical protein